MSLEDQKAQVEAAGLAFEQAAIERNKAVDAYDTARVEAMDEEVIGEAESLGINPRNFEDTAHLQVAIDKVKAEQPEETAE